MSRRPPTVITPELEERIVRDYESGVKVHEIVEKYGIGIGTLYKILDKHGVKRRRKVQKTYSVIIPRILEIIGKEGYATTSYLIDKLTEEFGMTRVRARAAILYAERAGLIRKNEQGVWVLTESGNRILEARRGGNNGGTQ